MIFDKEFWEWLLGLLTFTVSTELSVFVFFPKIFVIIRASLTANIWERKLRSSYWRVTYPCRCLCVPVRSLLWQNGWLDPDAVGDGESDQSKDACRGVVIVEGELRGSLGRILGVPL